MKTKILSIVAVIAGLGLFAGAATYMLNTHTTYECTLLDHETDKLTESFIVKDYRSHFVAEFPHLTVSSGTLKKTDFVGKNLKEVSNSLKNGAQFMRAININSETPRFGINFADDHLFSMGGCVKVS